MLQRRPADPDDELLDADEVGQEGVGQEQGEDEVHAVLEESPGIQVRSLAVESDRSAAPSLEPPLDRPEQKLHVDRLGAGPPAPDPPQQGREQEDGDGDAHHQQH